MPLVKVAALSEIKDNSIKKVSVEGEEIALYKVGGQIFATSAVCPHKGGPLEEGFLDGKTITCPWHGWKFSIQDGSALPPAMANVPSFKVVIQGNDVLVEV